MASFWDRIKQILGGQATTGGLSKRGVTRDLTQDIEAIIARRARNRESFEPVDIADEATAQTSIRTARDIQDACAVVDRLYQDGKFATFGYARSFRDGNWVYHHKSVDPATYSAPPPFSTSKATASTSAPKTQAPSASSSSASSSAQSSSSAKPAKSKPSSKDPLDASGILGLSKEELRKRALRINPYKTAWIGRVDTIPPQSDERTALIDRGLILRGFLNEDQIAEIHRVGDLWLKHHEAHKMAAAVASKAADKAMADQAKEKEAAKARKKKEAEARRKQRAADILRRKREDIIYLGPGVSKLLADRRSHIEELKQRGLPLMSTPGDVAKALGISVPELRWLCFHTEAAQRPHYVYFEVPKRSGGTRLLSAPHAKLGKAQDWVRQEILDKLSTEKPAHGFVKKRSTVTCATRHLQRDVVVNLDLSDFFPTISFPRVRGIFQRIGYSPAVATILALLCTEPKRTRVTFEGRQLWVAVTQRGLPQGACTSPALSNQVSKKLDRRLAGLCAKHGWAYTRYADDLTFSAPAGKRSEIPMFLARVRHIVQEEGFAVNPKKGRIQRAGGRQSVTGIVVNQKPSIPREEVRRLRAILHNAKKTGLEAQNRDSLPHFEAHLRGKISYLNMVDPDRAKPLLQQLDAIIGK